jgi:hypothetical protein
MVENLWPWDDDDPGEIRSESRNALCNFWICRGCSHPSRQTPHAAIDTREVASANATRLAVLSFDGFQLASRQFVRTLLPILPLLGFLGTVIGLATAISELPRGPTESADHAFDISGSLAGLAVKFETTLLGLLASMISSLSLNFLEKREAELSAACMLVVKAAGESDV